jgi:hypothetical protein
LGFPKPWSAKDGATEPYMDVFTGAFWEAQCQCSPHPNPKPLNRKQCSENTKCLIGTPDNTLQALSQSKNCPILYPVGRFASNNPNANARKTPCLTSILE